LRHRKEINDVTDQEFDWFALALNQLQRDGNWSIIAKVHAASDRQHHKTHGDPKTFLPWHRKYFIEVENRLQIAAYAAGLSRLDACSVTIPYWNWALEENFAEARVFDSDRLGAIDNGATSGDLDEMFCVKDGRFGTQTFGSEFGHGNNPFVQEDFMQEGCSILWGHNACMETIAALNDGLGSDCIFRRGGPRTRLFPRFPTLSYSQIVTALREHQRFQGVDNYENMATFIETELHNSVHGAIGGVEGQWPNVQYGHMTSMYSPYDPMFFLIHGFIDFLWSQWQAIHVEGQYRNHRAGDLLNNLLFDGNSDTFPVTDVAMSMDIKDDDPSTEHTEHACVQYHDRRTQHACASQWDEIQTCFDNLVSYEKLHTVPRIRHMTHVGDVCDPVNKLHFDTDRMWLETLAAGGMMRADHVNTVLMWERHQMMNIDNTTETLDAPETPHCDALTGSEREACSEQAQKAECDKALCFSATRMLKICSDCTSAGWSRTCHCSEASPAACWSTSF
jgi:tyrosinase